MQLLIVVLGGLGAGWLAAGQVRVRGNSPRPYLRASEIFQLAKSLGSPGNPGGSYPFVAKLALDSARLDAGQLIAFEENQFFVYAVGGSFEAGGKFQAGRNPSSAPGLIRRLIVLKPSTFVVDDEIFAPGSRVPIDWRLYGKGMAGVTGRRVRVIEGKEELFCERLFPQQAAHRVRRQPDGVPESERYVLEIVSQEKSPRARFLHLLHTGASSPESSGVRWELISEASQWHLTISAQGRIFRLTLPPGNEGAGEIAISEGAGKILLGSRPLPSGVLPHGPEGIRLLERWDADYRRERPPLWDTGQPSSELKRVVEEGMVRPSRALELCCGSGTDAIYLAGRGFDVTAIDIAPTALSRARQKARAAGVSVRWLLADVLAPPSLEPFEFIYDRGCYHEVRSQNLMGYLETIRRFSHPGTRFLLLAGNANQPGPSYGPPPVTEEELRNDFLPLFDLEWLRESRFETNQPGGIGPLAWSVLLRRKTAP